MWKYVEWMWMDNNKTILILNDTFEDHPYDKNQKAVIRKTYEKINVKVWYKKTPRVSVLLYF